MKTPALLASLALAGLLAQPASAQLPAQVAGAPVPTLAPMIKKVSPTVVGISTRGTPPQQQRRLMEDPFWRFFGGPPPQQQSTPSETDLAAGSGVIVDARNGYIITNAHVVANATKIKVTLDNGENVTAEIVGKDEGSDIAVLKVKEATLTAIPLGDSSTAEVGDFVVAIGNPFGFEHTVTSGIVSALGRSNIGDGDPNSTFQDFIQTDASINPGNSGGALVNLRGELIGINAAIFSGSGGNIGIGFAIPVNMVKSVMQQLVKYGDVKRGRLGVGIDPLTPSVARSLGIPPTLQGTVINRVEKGSPAEKAGVKVGDIVTALNGKPVKNYVDLRNTIGLMRIGEQVTVGLFRDGRQLTVNATITQPAADAVADAADIHPALQGVELANVPNGVGVIVRSVAAGSPIASRLQADDVIFGANRRPVQNVQQLREVAQGQRVLALNYRRDGQDLLLLIQQ